MSEQKVLITLFGATGDLAYRKLYPALFRLYQKGFLHQHFAVIGTARREWDNDYFRSIVHQSISSLPSSQEERERFSSHFYYLSHNVSDSENYVRLKELSEQLNHTYGTNGNRLFYLAMAPSFFGEIARQLKEQQLLSTQGYNRLIIEKPFGRDLASAKALNKELSVSFDEDQIYRIDHYLGKEMVQNITAVRFANRVFESLWSGEHISNVQITLAEAVSVEERGGYYDSSGALRDMVQNHILQILSLVAMEPPTSSEDIRQKKIDVLEKLRIYTPEEVNQHFVRGQYGPSAPSKLDGYRQDSQIADDSNTETFVAGRIFIDTPRWKDVPFYIRTGKSMGEKKTVVHVQFKEPVSTLFSSQQLASLESNRITIHITPREGFCFLLNSKAVGQAFELETTHLEGLHDEDFTLNSPEAYERLILDCLLGDSTNFTHWNEVAASWAFIDPIRTVWDKEKAPFPNYEAGTPGPTESVDLLRQLGHTWI